jgi:hypothetical protein
VPEQDVLMADATATSARVELPEISKTLTSLTNEVAGIRDNARFLHEDAQDLHHAVQVEDLNARTSLKARAGVQDLLQEIARRGFAWSTIAELVGVSVPALRKWRAGDGVSGENRREVARLAALCEWLDEYMITDVASWFEVPLADEVRVTPASLYKGGRVDLVLDYAAQRLGPERVLDEYEPGWRDALRNRFEVFEAGDGNLSLRKKA